MDASHKGRWRVLLPYFFDHDVKIGLASGGVQDGFFCTLTGFFETITDNSSREVIKTNYDVIQGEKRICCDLLRSGSARVKEQYIP